MRSKISCFDKTLLQKNVTRFAPFWAVYLLFLLTVLLIMRAQRPGYHFVAAFVEALRMSQLLNLGAAFLAAQLLFGDLYDPRLCYSLHALPLSREQFYGTGILSGLLFQLVPTAAAALVAAPLLAPAPVPNAALLAFYWWANANLSYLFFFGTAAVCALLAGNRLGQAALYAMVHFAGVFAYALVDTVYTPLLFGVVTPSEPFYRLNPLTSLWTNDALIDLKSEEIPIGPHEWTTTGSYTLGDCWDCLFLFAALGAALLIFGVYLYRRRRLEAAGDFLAVKALEPVVLVAISVGAGTGVMGAARMFNDVSGIPLLVLLALGVVVGWFAGRMLLERSTRVFRLKNWRGLAVLAGAFVLTMGLTRLDPLDIEGRIPASEEIDTVRLSYSGDLLTEDFDLVRTLHSQALEYRVIETEEDRVPTDEEPRRYTLPLDYNLKNGGTVMRRYTLDVTTPAGQTLNRLLNRVPTVFHAYRADSEEPVTTPRQLLDFSQKPSYICIGSVEFPSELLTKQTVDTLFTAMLADMAEEHMAQDWVFHPPIVLSSGDEIYGGYSVHIQFPAPKTDDPAMAKVDRFNILWLDIYPDCTHTLAALADMGITTEMLRAGWEQSSRG